MEEVDVLVVGAGAVGLAVGRALAMRGREVVVAEAGDAPGLQTSSRNSGVIHAGLYYPPGSLKARLCMEGRQRLYAFCESRQVAHRRCGKLVVAAAPSEFHRLEALAVNAAQSGVDDLRWLDRAQARALEPELDVEAALLSPSSGILDVGGYLRALQGELEDRGGVVALRTEVVGLEPRPAGGVAVALAGEGAARLLARTVVNAAGLRAPELAARTDGLAPDARPRAFYAKGSYFALPGRAPFSRLVYPMPEPGGLGVHLTLDLAGRARFGPDVQWVDGVDYRVDPARCEGFYAAVRRYWPDLPDGALAPDFAGLRPKLSGPGEPAADFRIDGLERHGVEGLVNLFGIESPGLTASLAIAEVVADRLDGRFQA